MDHCLVNLLSIRELQKMKQVLHNIDLDQVRLFVCFKESK